MQYPACPVHCSLFEWLELGKCVFSSVDNHYTDHHQAIACSRGWIQAVQCNDAKSSIQNQRPGYYNYPVKLWYSNDFLILNSSSANANCSRMEACLVLILASQCKPWVLMIYERNSFHTPCFTLLFSTSGNFIAAEDYLFWIYLFLQWLGILQMICWNYSGGLLKNISCFFPVKSGILNAEIKHILSQYE
jgi:hypothetical protein